MTFRKVLHPTWLVLIFLFTGCSQQPDENAVRDAELARLEARAAGVTIIRDDFGVPHIYAKTDADVISKA